MKRSLYIASLLALCAGAAFANDVPPDFVGGNTDGSDRNSSITSDVSGSYFRIVGGNQNANAPTGNVNGDITLNLDNVDISYGNGFICGGNLLNYLDNPADHPDTMGYVSGKITINFNSGTLSASQGLYGGNAGGIKSQNNNYVGEVEMNLNGGNVIGDNGAYVAGSGANSGNVKGDVVINMNAGNISEIVGVNGGASVGGKVVINAKGGKLGKLYAGGQSVSSVIEGGTNILLGGDVAVSGDVYAGGWYNDREDNRSTIKNGTKITLTDNATVAGTINGGGVNGTTIVEGKKVLNLGTADAAYNGTSTLKIADFDTINVAKGTTASVEKIEQNLTGAVAGSRTFVNEGANFTVEGDIVNTLENATNNSSFVAGLTSVKGDLQSGGSAVVKGTVKTVINGADTKLHFVYGGNGGNQKSGTYTALDESGNEITKTGTVPLMTSTVGGVDIVVNNGSVDMIVASGAMYSDVLGDVDITVNNGTVGDIYGGACGGNIGGNVNVLVNGGTVSSIAAGGCASSVGSYRATTGIVGGSTNVVIGGEAKVLGDVYGGGWPVGEDWRDTVKGDTTITLKDNATVGGTLYGGGWGGTGTIEGSKNLNIGTAESAYNGASALKVADFQKIGIVNGSVEFAAYTQAAEGTLISISKGALLTATVASADQFSNTSVENGGSLVLKRGELADSATASFKDYTGSGAVTAFGGTFANGTFTAGRSAVASAGLTVGTGASDVQSVRFGDGALSLDFDVSTMGENEITINSIAKSTDTTGIDGTVLAAFDIDASYDFTNQWSVLMSVAVSLDGIDEASLKAWHKGADGKWTLADNTVSVADGIASIVADGFSSWAISGAAIPEPAEWAAVLGALALAIAAYRRRSGR